jgi:hypothetical protein
MYCIGVVSGFCHSQSVWSNHCRIYVSFDCILLQRSKGVSASVTSFSYLCCCLYLVPLNQLGVHVVQIKVNQVCKQVTVTHVICGSRVAYVPRNWISSPRRRTKAASVVYTCMQHLQYNVVRNVIRFYGLV